MTAANEVLSASLEDYLEAIFLIVTKKHAVRAKDIASALKVNSSSVTGALRTLAEKSLVNYAPYDVISLTPKGLRVAKDVLRRHEALRDFLIKVLAVNERDAEETACKMEHVVPRKIVNRIVQFVKYMETCPRGGTKWAKEFGYYCEDGAERKDCEVCFSLCPEGLKDDRESDD